MALFLRETKEQPLPKLAFCQVGGGDVSGGTTSPPPPTGFHTHTAGYEVTRYRLIRQEALSQPLCSVRFEKTCHVLNGCCDQEEAPAARG